MARILFTVPPFTGHFNPAAAVADILSAQGHQVAWALDAAPLAKNLPADACIFQLDSDHDGDTGQAAAGVRGLASVRLFLEDYTIPMARRVLPQIEATMLAFRPDVLVVDHQMPAGALAARKLGCPWASLVTTTASIQIPHQTLDDWTIAKFHALQQSCLPDHLIVPRPDLSPFRVIVFSVQALIGDRGALIEAPYAFVGPAQGGSRPDVDFPWHWLQPDRKHVLVTLGTISKNRDTRFFEVIIDAFANLPDIQAVLVAPMALQARAPANVLVRDYVPQPALLERMDAVICHAGHNTVCEALLAGLPMIVAPIRDDQPVIARQVIDAGAGLFMRYGKVTPQTAKATIEALLSTGSLAGNAGTLAKALRAAGGAEEAARCILELVGGGR